MTNAQILHALSRGQRASLSAPDYVAEVLENAQMMADEARRYVDKMAD